MTAALSVCPNRRVVVPVDLSARPKAPRRGIVRSLQGETMGTTWSVKLAAPPDMELAEIHRQIDGVLEGIVAEMSPWEPQSHISRFNRAPPGSWHRLPDSFFAVLECALSVAEDSGGAYDPTIGSLVDLWGFGPAGPRTEQPELLLHDATTRCGRQRIDISRVQQSVRQPGGVSLDLCAIAKGFAVDRVADLLRASGCADFLIEIGGELRGEGVKPDGSPWWVALEPPRPGAASAIGETVVALHGLSVATSGDYRRYFERNGRRHAHTIDPRSGHPVANGVIAATVLHQSCMTADACSTALMVLGEVAGMAWAAERNLPALLVVEDGAGLRQVSSPAFAAMAA